VSSVSFRQQITLAEQVEFDRALQRQGINGQAGAPQADADAQLAALFGVQQLARSLYFERIAQAELQLQLRLHLVVGRVSAIRFHGPAGHFAARDSQ